MAAEFDQALPEEESARLMARIGQRFADAHGLPPVATVEALQASVNALMSGVPVDVESVDMDGVLPLMKLWHESEKVLAG